MIKQEKVICRRLRFLLAIFMLAVTLLVGPGVPVLNASVQTESETLGKLEYFNRLTREDLFSVSSVEVSPDGRHAYAAAWAAHAVTVFGCDKDTGHLEHIQTVSGRDALRGAAAARVSPCGHYVVCPAIRSHMVNLFERDRSTGKLKFLYSAQEGEDDVENLNHPVDAAFSQDSRFVYVIASQSASVGVFRITDERKLAFVECTNGKDSCFNGARGITVGPKDKYLYVASSGANTLVVLERIAVTGKTKLRQVIKDEQGGVHGLAGAFSVACSPDGKFVYTSSGRFEGDNAVCVFEKASDGTLSLVQEIFNGQNGVNGFVGGNEIIISRDGRNVYAIGTRSNAVVTFGRNVETGKLTYLQSFKNRSVAGKGSASGIGISPDGKYVYVAGEIDSSVLIFKRLTGTK